MIVTLRDAYGSLRVKKFYIDDFCIQCRDRRVVSRREQITSVAIVDIVAAYCGHPQSPGDLRRESSILWLQQDR